MLYSLSGRRIRVTVSKMHRRAGKTRKCPIAVEEDVSGFDRSPFPSVQRLGAVIARALAGSSSVSLWTARDFYLAFARSYPEEGCATGPIVNQTDLSAREPASVIFKSPTTCAPRYRRPGTDHLRLAGVHANATRAAKDASTAEKCTALGRELRGTNLRGAAEISRYSFKVSCSRARFARGCPMTVLHSWPAWRSSDIADARSSSVTSDSKSRGIQRGSFTRRSTSARGSCIFAARH